MDITISLPDELDRQLSARAGEQGLSVVDFVGQVARREARQPVRSEIADNGRTRPDWQEEIEKFRQSRAWLEIHRAEYAGQWVCLDGDRLISHGPDAKRVYAEADAKGIPSPFVEYIPNENLPFGGW